MSGNKSSEVTPYDRGAQKYVLVEWLAFSRLNPDLMGSDVPLLDLEHFPSSLIELGREIGVAPQQLSKWMRGAAIEKAVASRIRQISAGMFVESLQDINRVLIRQAKKGDKDALKLFYARVDRELYDIEDIGEMLDEGQGRKDNANITQINIQVQNIIDKQKMVATDKWDDSEFDDGDFEEV